MTSDSNVGQPPTEHPAAMPPRRRQTNQSQASAATFYKRVKDARSVAITILESTEWPQRSRTAAEELLKAIENSPNDQSFSADSDDVPADLRQAVEQFTSILREVSVKLDKISKKYGTRKRGIRERIKYFLAMLREGRCDQILRTCQADVNTASNVIRERWGDGATDDLGSSPRSRVTHPTTLRSPNQEPNVSSAQDHAPGTAQKDERVRSTGTLGSNAMAPASPNDLEQPKGHSKSPTPIISSSSPPEANPPRNQPSTAQPQQNQSPNVPENESKKSRRQDYLNVANKVFAGVEAVSGVIPIVGSYVGAAAKVGLTCVEMVQGMDSNDEVARGLQEHTSHLSEILEQFKDQSFEPERATTTKLITDLQRLFSSDENAGQLQEWEKKIQRALDEIQLLLNINTADRVTDLYIAEVQKERRELLACLGDANHGARDDEIENIVCHPGTRVDILDRINDWVSGGERSQRLLWLRGMAGRGKSAIASTVASEWKKRKASCTLFHFRRGQTALSKRLVCALARQLICGGTPEVREAILQAVRINRDVATTPMEEQFRVLLIQSLRKLEPDSPPVLLVIDALDECEDPDYAVRFLKAIARHTAIPANIKFLVTSRPEDPLMRVLQRQEWLAEDLDTVSKTNVDIALFLRSGLSKIRTEHGLAEDWPPSEAVDSLTRSSQGLFQWAHTVIKYIGEKMPKRRLGEVVNAPT
ncbi:hypothetical protein FRC00_003489, partial [Tulasnella sp. 408]